ncbi:hypothetical protein ACFW88_08350 [Streptomyces anandii]|uniref:Pyridine nucleotide-disulphide oxidoreductase dimerisation domain-containing protein n=1 Tax=Streptomyces anandii TaxID=285454 RepID=A0ABW6H1Q4_9ACTN
MPETDRGVTVALAVRNDIHRYGLEGMLRSLDVVSGTFSYPTVADTASALSLGRGRFGLRRGFRRRWRYRWWPYRWWGRWLYGGFVGGAAVE